MSYMESKMQDAIDGAQSEYARMSEEIGNLLSENDRLQKIVDAASALVNCKGRYHAEQNMIALAKLIKGK